METLNRKLSQFENALNTLISILKEPKTEIVRDATIQRFEYTFEIFWKFLREYCRFHEGILLNSPKSVFRQIQAINLTSEEETIQCLKMTDDRNLSTHLYNEKLADELFSKISDYANLIQTIKNRIEI